MKLDVMQLDPYPLKPIKIRMQCSRTESWCVQGADILYT